MSSENVEPELAEVPLEESEGYRVLLDLSQGKTGDVPPEWLARHVPLLNSDADWPVQRAAMEAVLRRHSFARRDSLRVAERPRGGRPFGVYRTRRYRSSLRPYSTLLASLDPIVASCDCADFVRNSLGVCKHVLTVVGDVVSRPRALKRALESEERQSTTPRSGPTLAWDSVRPLYGAGDWLDRIRIDGLESGNSVTGFDRIRKHFRHDGDGVAHLRSAYADDNEKRLSLVNDLWSFVESGRGSEGAPALVALLRMERNRLLQLRKSTLSSAQIRSALRGLNVRPYRYQREGIAQFFESGRLLLADDMGLGKTAQAIAICHALRTTDRVRRGLIVVPSSLKPQWMREWKSFTDVPIENVEGSPREREAHYRRAKKVFLLTSYELLLRDLGSIQSWKPEIVVLDEAQRIKNWATKTALSVKRLAPKYRLVLTGTPMENRLEELASVFEWVDSFALEPKWRLVPFHTTYTDGSKQVRGARNLDTLRTRMAKSMIRRTRAEVLDQLPTRSDTLVPVEMTGDQKEEHAALNQPIASILGRARRRPLTPQEFLKLMSLLTTQRIIANGLAQLRFNDIWPGLRQSPPELSVLRGLATPKLIEVREILTQLVGEQGRKVIVFSQWRRMLKLANWAVSDVLADAGKRAVFFTGQERPKRRTQNIVELHDDPATSVLFASDAGGVGLNLQKAASCCINLDLPWNPAVLEQRIGRIYRIGQNQPISVYNLVTEGSIESRIASLVSDKKALFSGLFDGTSDEVDFDSAGSFLSKIERIVEVPEITEADEDAELDGEQPALERELDELISTASESADDVGGSGPADSFQTAELSDRDREDGEAIASGAGEVGDLFAQLKMSPTADGGISIEAPREAAATLATLFEGMAKLMRSQANPK